MSSWSLLTKTNDRWEAGLIKSKLESAGIQVVLLDQVDSSYPMFGTIRIMVLERDREDAEQLLNETEDE